MGSFIILGRGNFIEFFALTSLIMTMYKILELSIMQIIHDIDFNENQTFYVIERYCVC